MNNCQTAIDTLQIGLQFPDALLSDAARVAAQLQAAIAARVSSPRTVFILGDTSYARHDFSLSAPCHAVQLLCGRGGSRAPVGGSDCALRPLVSQPVPVAACKFSLAHVYFSTSRIPVLFVFGRAAVDVDACAAFVQQTVAAAARPVLLVADVAYVHALRMDGG